MRDRARRPARLAGRCVGVALALAGSWAAAAEPATGATEPPAVRYRFTVPGDTVPFHGIVNFDNAGLRDGEMMYTGGAVGLVVGVIVQAVITDVRRKREKTALQERADEVVAPYGDGLAHWSQHDLFERGVVRMATPGDKAAFDGAPAGVAAGADEWLVDYAPQFAMNQDSRALVLDNVLTISHGGDAPYRNTIRVVSAPLKVDEPESFWAADDLANLKAESARLLALSFDLALGEARDAARPHAPVPQRTLRYRVGGEERMERAELLGQTCDRIVMRTLRGWMLSAPVARTPPADADGKRCEETVVAGS